MNDPNSIQKLNIITYLQKHLKNILEINKPKLKNDFKEILRLYIKLI